MHTILKHIVVWILTMEARLVLLRHAPRIVAVTGNVGKTSAKDAIHTALARSYRVRKSQKSMNSETGVPLTIIGTESGWNSSIAWMRAIIKGVVAIASPSYPEWLVLEVGADRPGDIKRIARWLSPRIAVITGIPEIPVHVEFFESAEDVAKEKRELALALSEGGTLILNGDNEYTRAMLHEFRGASVTYGFESKCDFTASHDEIMYEHDRPSGMTFRVNHAGSSVPIQLAGTLGRAQIYATLAAIAVGVTTQDDVVSLGAALSAHEPPAGRMRVLGGVNKATIIDDSYNSSPAATVEALETLKRVRVAGRKIAVLGDMLELGSHTSAAHAAAGKLAAGSADMLVVIGVRARGIAEAAQEAGMSEKSILKYAEGTSAQVGQDIARILKGGDAVLVKGSQGMRMERTVAALLADPETAPDLLVRHDAAWLNR